MSIKNKLKIKIENRNDTKHKIINESLMQTIDN